MNRFLAITALIGLAAASVADDKGLTKPALPEKKKPHPKWGKPADFYGKFCMYRSSDNSLAIDMPASTFDLSLDKRKDTAPRLLQEIRVPRTVEVRVALPLPRNASARKRGDLPTVGAGLVIYQSGALSTFVVYERILTHPGQHDPPGCSDNVTLQRRLPGAMSTETISVQLNRNEEWMRLRLTFESNSLKVEYFLRDNNKWQTVAVREGDFSKAITVGFVAYHNLEQAYTAQFDRLVVGAKS